MTRPPYVVPARGRAAVTDQGWTATIEVPPERPWGPLLFMSFWLVGWALGEATVGVMVLARLLGWTPEGGDGASAEGFAGLFMVAWLGLWTVGGVTAIRAWLWMAFGRETITASTDGLEIRRRTLGTGKAKAYGAAHVRNLRVVRDPLPQAAAFRMGGRRKSGGPLAFDYGADTVRFGGSLSEGEADLLLPVVRDKLRLPAGGSS